ncbi:MAG: YicC/YloC family endoribonuclease [Bacteroidia bacterium]
MLRSMTGYGQATMENDRYSIKVEFKSLNNKFLELNIRLPKSWMAKDTELRKEMGKLVERGSCHISVNVSFKQYIDTIVPVNREVVKYYLNELRSIGNEFNLDVQSLSQHILTLPNVLQAEEIETSGEDDDKFLMDVLNESFIDFEKFRMKEGEMLKEELERMTQAILRLVDEIDEMENERIEIIRGKIEEELIQLRDNIVDKNRFEQELIYYLEKLDISEEKARLINHCNYFLETMNLKSSGKKMGFIAQEMGREINTIGAKANHYKMQQRVVEMKDELEKIKEQVNNVL